MLAKLSINNKNRCLFEIVITLNKTKKYHSRNLFLN